MKLAAQMYTLREFTQTPESLDKTLGMVAAIGYPAVQLSAIGAVDKGLMDASEVRSLLDKHGLKCCATHRPLKRLIDHTDDEIAIHKILGCDYVAVGSIAGDYGMEPDSYRRFLLDARPMIAALKSEGIRFGFHNHALEFQRRGRNHYDLLLGEPDLELEIDVYWVAVAGLDPAALLRRAEGRIAAVHLKDLEVFGWEAPTYAPVGEGNLDWDAILAACREGGTEWGIVEQDTCRRDPFDCLASSYRFLSERV
ncbi:sugar phosphate isomerase/epimerase [bacterium]|nr:MAG: sugar phosphate isomerase/epimerase [bacterium]